MCLRWRSTGLFNRNRTEKIDASVRATLSYLEYLPIANIAYGFDALLGKIEGRDLITRIGCHRKALCGEAHRRDDSNSEDRDGNQGLYEGEPVSLLSVVRSP